MINFVLLLLKLINDSPFSSKFILSSISLFNPLILLSVFISLKSNLKITLKKQLFKILFPYVPSSKLNMSDISCVIAILLPPNFLIVLNILYIKLATSLFDVTPINLQISSK